MFKNLSQRDKRALKLGIPCIVVVLLYTTVISDWLEKWRSTRVQLATKTEQLDSILLSAGGVSKAKQAGLFDRVPVFEMPQSHKKQLPLFRGKLNEQLKQAGIKVNTLKPVGPGRAKKSAGSGTLMLECRGKCKYSQVLDLIVALQENPYFVGIEQLNMKFNSKDRKEMDLVLVVSTFVK